MPVSYTQFHTIVLNAKIYGPKQELSLHLSNLIDLILVALPACLMLNMWKKNFIKFCGSSWWKQLMEAISRKRFQETYHNYWNCPGVVGRLVQVMHRLWEHQVIWCGTKHLQQKPEYGMVRTNKHGTLFCALCEAVLVSYLLLKQKCSKQHSYDFSQLPFSKQIYSFIQAIYIYRYKHTHIFIWIQNRKVSEPLW